MMKEDSLVNCRFVMVVTPLFFLLLGVVFEYSGFDVWWVSHFYDFQGQNWPFEHHWLFDTVIHTWGQDFSKGMVLVWFSCFVLSFFKDGLKKHRKLIGYILPATAVGPILVSISKSLTHIYTPWDLQLFHGAQPYIRILDHVPAGLPVGHAFPSGHASGGYGFFSLYFLLLYLQSPRRGYGFLCASGLGLVFGIGQQIRGAHFPSHDLFSMVLCWYGALAMYSLFFSKEWAALKKL